MLCNKDARQQVKVLPKHDPVAVSSLAGDCQATLQGFLGSLPVAAVVVDREDRVMACNHELESLFSYSKGELLGRALRSLLAIDPSQPAGSEPFGSLQDESSRCIESCRRGDGSLIEVEKTTSPLALTSGKRVFLQIFKDLSPRREAERELRESEERFRCLAEAAFEGIMINDGERIVDANEQLARMFGVELSAVIGSKAWAGVDPEAKETVKQRIRSGDERPYQVTCVRANGSRFLIEIHGKSISYRGRRARVSVLRDITEHKRLEEELRQAQKMEAIGRLAGGVSHDFNNLLTVIQGHAQLLTLQLGEDHPLHSGADEIYRCARRAAGLTQQLLTFSRKQTVMPRDLDLNKVVSGAEDMLRRLISEDIVLSTELKPGLPWVKADPGQLEQVILNLAINARDAMPHGGKLTLKTEWIDVEPARPRPTPELALGDHVRLSVTDTGCGMDKTTSDRAFEPFFTTKSKGEGTGLGLATVYGIVKQNNGTITIDSCPGQGTALHVYLPAVRRVTAEPKAVPSSALAPKPPSSTVAPKLQTAAATALPRGHETVLVVEDVPELGRVIAASLRRQGYTVLTAADPRTALRLVEHHDGTIHLLLSDLVMPNMSGVELAQRLKEHYPELNVLMISGYSEERLLRGDGSGAGLPFLQKPFTMDVMAAKVRQVLDDPR